MIRAAREKQTAAGGGRPAPTTEPQHDGAGIMSRADDDDFPTIWLDKEIARLALGPARELVAAGLSPEEAATLACRGAAAQWRAWVSAVLSGERSLLRDIITSPQEAAEVIGQVYKAGANAEALRRAENAESEADAEFWRAAAALL